MNTLWKDMKYTIRTLFRTPGFTIASVLTLALGIGANSAIFSVVNTVLLRPLPFDEPAQLVMLWQTNVKENKNHLYASHPNIMDWKRENHVFEDIALIGMSGWTYMNESESIRIQGLNVSSGFFPLLRVKPMLGRVFTEDEDREGDPNTVVLGYDFWQTRCGSDRDIVGKTITLDSKSFTVAGVLPSRFDFPESVIQRADIWLPIAQSSWAFHQRGALCLYSLARLKQHVSLERAQSEIDVIASRLEKEYGENEGTGVHITSLLDETVGDYRLTLLILFGAVGFVLMIACVNAANLLLVRACAREKEFTIRAALGARRFQLIRQTMIESLTLSVAGGSVGLLVAYWCFDTLKGMIPGDLPRIDELSVDWTVVGFTLSLTMVTGVFFGTVPALRLSYLQTWLALKDGTRSTEGSKRLAVRNILAVSEISFAVVLLVGAALLLQSFIKLIHVDPGFQKERVLTWKVSLPGSKYKEAQQSSVFFKEYLTKLERIPDIQSVGASSLIPFSNQYMGVGLRFGNSPKDDPNSWHPMMIQFISPGYFQTLGIPLAQGRGFQDSDDRGNKGVAIINETASRSYFPDGKPIGQRIYCGLQTSDSDPEFFEVVGVAEDSKHQGYDSDVKPVVYFCCHQMTYNTMTFLIRSKGEPMALAGAVRRALHDLDRSVPADHIKTMDRWMSDSVAQRRFAGLLTGLFAVLSVGLTAIGVYGVVAYSVSQRTHEIGVRMALGAQTANVMSMVLKSGLKLTAMGIGIGVAGALVLSRFLQSLLFAISPADPITFVAVSIVLTAVILLACYIPARRAAKVDPMVALRCE